MGMIQDVTIFIFLAVGAFAMIILAGIAAAVFMRGKTPQNTEPGTKLGTYVKIFDFGMFILIGFSLVPIMVKILTDALEQIIKNSPLPQTLQQNAMLIVYFFWIIAAGGLAIAFPSIQKSGFFQSESTETAKNPFQANSSAPPPPAPQAPQPKG